MTEKEHEMVAELEARLEHTGHLLINLATFLEGASLVDHAGRTAFIIADTNAWENLHRAVNQVAR